MALNGLNCAYVPLRNYSLTHSKSAVNWQTDIDSEEYNKMANSMPLVCICSVQK